MDLTVTFGTTVLDIFVFLGLLVLILHKSILSSTPSVFDSLLIYNYNFLMTLDLYLIVPSLFRNNPESVKKPKMVVFL